MKSLLLCCMLMPAFSLFAQDSTTRFELKDYKYRTPGFRALSFDFSMAASSAASNVKNGPEYSSGSYSISPAVFNFFKTSSTDKRLSQSNYSFSLYGQSNVNKIDNSKQSQKSGIAAFTWQLRNQYFRRNNWFWEFGNKINTNATFNDFKNEPDYNKQQSYYADETLTLGLGKGRLENVQDAQMALFILNDLRELGLVSSSYTGEQAHEFARLITDINNQRVFDSRKRRIYELQRIDSFLKNTGLASTTDVRHFTTVNDNWVFAYNPFRLHGNQWYVRVKPSAGILQQVEKSTLPVTTHETRTVRSIGVSPEAGFESQKAKSLHWQRSFIINVSYMSSVNNEVIKNKGVFPTETKNEYNQQQADIYSSYSLGYFPNTRTRILGTLGASATYFEGYDFDQIVIARSFLTIATSYFLGYRTTLNAVIGFSYERRDIESPMQKMVLGNFNFNSGISFTHFIF